MNSLLAFGAPTYELTRSQWTPRGPDEVFGFFEEPHNLAIITPSWLNFRIVSMEPPAIRVGTKIVYRLKWMGIPYRWETLIAEWAAPSHFVDTQVHGPYILWHHTHTFKTIGAGVLIHDRVRYRLPFGPAGALLHSLLVRRQINEIFDYRMQKIAELLSGGIIHTAPPEGP